MTNSELTYFVLPSLVAVSVSHTSKGISDRCRRQGDRDIRLTDLGGANPRRPTQEGRSIGL